MFEGQEDQARRGGSPWDPYNAKIQAGYQQYLGRGASEDELRMHHGGNPNGYADENLYNTAIGNIQNSEEAKAYKARTAANTGTTNTVATVLDSDGVSVRRGPMGGGAQAQATTPAFQPAASMGAAPAQAARPAITDQVTELLKKRLTDLSNPLDLANDPVHQGQLRAAQIASLRGADRQRAALAERAAAGGTLSGGTGGGFDVGVQGILDNQRETDRGFAAELAGERLSAREQQLMQAITLARAMGQDEIANQLDAQRFDLQQELGRGDLSLRYDNLGLSYADLIQRANRDAVLAAL